MTKEEIAALNNTEGGKIATEEIRAGVLAALADGAKTKAQLQALTRYSAVQVFFGVSVLRQLGLIERQGNAFALVGGA